MTAAQLVEPTGVHPRRRPVINTALPGQLTDSYSGSSKMRLKKGETFHTPTTPSSNERDPVLNIRSLPRRSPTSLEAIAASEQRMASILERLTLEDRQGDSPESTRNDLSVSQGPLDAHVGPDTPSESCPSESGREIHSKENKLQVHSYESDSGLGSSVGSRVESVKSKSCSPILFDGFTTDRLQVDTEIHAGKAFTSPVSAFEAGSTSRRQLGITACKQIERYILVPILKEPKLKPFHPLVQSIPRRIVNKQVVCLRDLEKTLLWLAPVCNNPPLSFTMAFTMAQPYRPWARPPPRVVVPHLSGSNTPPVEVSSAAVNAIVNAIGCRREYCRESCESLLLIYKSLRNAPEIRYLSTLVSQFL